MAEDVVNQGKCMVMPFQGVRGGGPINPKAGVFARVAID
jgi:hypothetical protein